MNRTRPGPTLWVAATLALTTALLPASAAHTHAGPFQQQDGSVEHPIHGQAPCHYQDADNDGIPSWKMCTWHYWIENGTLHSQRQDPPQPFVYGDGEPEDPCWPNAGSPACTGTNTLVGARGPAICWTHSPLLGMGAPNPACHRTYALGPDGLYQGPAKISECGIYWAMCG